MRFSKMPPEVEEVYERLKHRNQKASIHEMHEQTKQMKQGSSRYQRDHASLENLIFFMSDTQGMTYQEIAEVSGMPYSTVKGIAWRKRNGGRAEEEEAE